MRIAVAGAGIAGLGAARALSRHHDVVLFEREKQPGGHAHTVEVGTRNGPVALDTGFLVYNERNYPELVRLFNTLDVATQPSDMSFSVQRNARGRRLEWAGGIGAAGLFAQRLRFFDPVHWGLLAEILRFNRVALKALDSEPLHGTLGEFLEQHEFSHPLTWSYLIPMTAAIWSCPPEQMLDSSAQTLLRFLFNHGLLHVRGRPQWRSVSGGCVNYVRNLLARSNMSIRLGTPVIRLVREPTGVAIESSHGREHFDACILACHADESLALLGDADAEERRILGVFRFSTNIGYLHSDASFMPAARRAWASWNVRMDRERNPQAGVSVTYWLNRLQRLSTPDNYFVTLNPVHEPREIIKTLHYTHPVLDTEAVDAQQALIGIQGRGGLYYAGAWTRYGFHEDGLVSGLAAARAIGTGNAAEERQP